MIGCSTRNDAYANEKDIYVSLIVAYPRGKLIEMPFNCIAGVEKKNFFESQGYTQGHLQVLLNYLVFILKCEEYKIWKESKIQ